MSRHLRFVQLRNSMASKGALTVLTRSLAVTRGPEIRVNAICPGMIQTRWLKAGLDDERYEPTVKVGTQLSPLKKVATADEVAADIGARQCWYA